MEVRYWQHPAEASISITDDIEESETMHIYTDGSKTEKGVGSGIVIFEAGRYIGSIQRRLNKKGTNNQSEQHAILAALQYIETVQRTESQFTRTVK
jgi:ribonuclease HI